MIKICFVCLGNICRSPMAEFIMKNLVKEKKLNDMFFIESKATSYEESGNGIYPPAKRKLIEKGIEFSNSKRSIRLQKEDYDQYDYIIGMEKANIVNIKRIVDDKDNKVYRLLDFSSNPHDISDPWYSGDFDKTYDDILEGCESFLNFLFANMDNYNTRK